MSVLRYPGGKTRAVKILADYVPDDAYVILSPFTGGGSFELYLRNSGKYILGNDLFEPLYNFWFCLAEYQSRLIDEVTKLRPCTKEMFLEMRRKVMTTDVDSVTRAAYYFAINRCSFSGSTLSGGYSAESADKRFTESSIERLRKFSPADFDIQNMDANEFIDMNVEYDFMYLDPPYFLGPGNKLYGKGGDLHSGFDHERLHTTLSTLPNWIMSYNDCAWVREKYSDYEIVPLTWSYGMNQTKKSSEVLIISAIK